MRFAVVWTFALAACTGKGVLTHHVEPEAAARFVDTEEVDGAVTAVLDPSSAETQVIQGASGSSVSETTIAFPPGSLSIQTSITVAEAQSLASTSVATELGVDTTALVSAGKSVLIESSAALDPVQPFTIGLAIDNSAGLLADTSKIVILYQIKKYGEGGAIYFGVIPASAITIEGNIAKFQASYFGSYQPIQAVEAVQNVVEKKTEVPIVAAADADAVGTGELGYTTGDLKAGTKYYWRVEAVNAAGTVVGVSQTREFTTK